MKIVEGGTLLPPNLCLICEETHHDRAYVDTYSEIDPDHFTKLSGRKYVCLHCLDKMAVMAGYEHSTLAREAEDFLEAHRARSLELRQKFAGLALAALDNYHALPESAVDHAPPTAAEVFEAEQPEPQDELPMIDEAVEPDIEIQTIPPVVKSKAGRTGAQKPE